MLRLFLTLLLLAVPAAAQTPAAAVPFFDGALTVLSDGTVAYSNGFAVSFVNAPESLPRSPLAGWAKAIGDVPRISTTYLDVNGAQQRVDTPITNTTPEGIQEAIKLHDVILKAMQRMYPPLNP